MRRMFLATLVIVASTAVAYSQTSATRKAIEANTRSFVEAFNKGDAAAVAQIYAADAKILPPNEKIVEGRANIQAFWQGAIGAGLKMTSLTPTTITPAGNLLVETGKYVMTIPAGGATITDEGKYVVVWRREGRNWKIIRDIFNSDKPAQ
ncbi:MAG TPA: DUF4440 domain-containing protein [Pyrinomonadaceae bacterium]